MSNRKTQFGDFEKSDRASIDHFYNVCKQKNMVAVWLERRGETADLFYDLASVAPAFERAIPLDREQIAENRLWGVFSILGSVSKDSKWCFGDGFALGLPLPIARIAARAIAEIFAEELQRVHRDAKNAK